MILASIFCANSLRAGSFRIGWKVHATDIMVNASSHIGMNFSEFSMRISFDAKSLIAILKSTFLGPNSLPTSFAADFRRLLLKTWRISMGSSLSSSLT